MQRLPTVLNDRCRATSACNWPCRHYTPGDDPCKQRTGPRLGTRPLHGQLRTWLVAVCRAPATSRTAHGNQRPATLPPPLRPTTHSLGCLHVGLVLPELVLLCMQLLHQQASVCLQALPLLLQLLRSSKRPRLAASSTCCRHTVLRMPHASSQLKLTSAQGAALRHWAACLFAIL